MSDKNVSKPTQKREMRIRNLPQSRNKQFRSVAAYYGQTSGEYWRGELLKLLDTYPEHIKAFTIDNEDGDEHTADTRTTLNISPQNAD